MPKSKGFTLVELLITISIISVLAAIGLVVYSSVIKQGRDSKRQSDLRSIQSALEQYYADQFSYPSAPLPVSPNPLKSPNNLKTYINQMPSDPNSSRRYYYAITGTSYELCAALEISPNPAQSCGGSCGSNCNFKVTPP
ncbi:MAG: prepilin-type N-terminal cleavage/methylation domain-containing protein [Candidatus Daviesbacteria bacterium]|nr:prepilin-type N-terminal cleavage/methylation domain-containing protein [Candidatus Daviesbacteria bacterium]